MENFSKKKKEYTKHTPKTFLVVFLFLLATTFTFKKLGFSLEGDTYLMGKEKIPTEKELFELLLKEGGFTFDDNKFENLINISGYAVSLYGFEVKIDLDSFDVQDISSFMEKNKETLKDPNVHLGGWVDEESRTVYLDLSRIFENIEEAKKFAKENNQIAIFNFNDFSTILLKN